MLYVEVPGWVMDLALTHHVSSGVPRPRRFSRDVDREASSPMRPVGLVAVFGKQGLRGGDLLLSRGRRRGYRSGLDRGVPEGPPRRFFESRRRRGSRLSAQARQRTAEARRGAHSGQIRRASVSRRRRYRKGPRVRALPRKRGVERRECFFAQFSPGDETRSPSPLVGRARGPRASPGRRRRADGPRHARGARQPVRLRHAPRRLELRPRRSRVSGAESSSEPDVTKTPDDGWSTAAATAPSWGRQRKSGARDAWRICTAQASGWSAGWSS